MLCDILKPLVLEHLPALKKSPKGWLTCNCPLCNRRGHRADRKGRFGVTFPGEGQIGVSCFNCFFKAKYVPKTSLSKDFLWFLEAIGVKREDLQKIKLQAFREREGGSLFEDPVLQGSLFKSWKTRRLPKDSFPILTWLENDCNDPNLLRVAEYALSRNISLEDIFWAPTDYNEYNKRFILPFKFRNRVVGYTARYGDDITDGKTLRYINSMPDNYIYNLDAQDNYNRKYCLLHEGVLDAYITTGISCLGSINKEKVEIINRLEKDIIVCPDRDRDGSRLVEVAMEEGWAVSFPKWAPNIKDAGKASEVYGRLLTVKSILQSIERYSLKISVARKLDHYVE